MIICFVNIAKTGVYKSKVQVEIHIRFFQLPQFDFLNAFIRFIDITISGIRMSEGTESFQRMAY